MFRTGGSFQPDEAFDENEFNALWAFSMTDWDGSPWLLVYTGGDGTFVIGFNKATGFVFKLAANGEGFTFVILFDDNIELGGSWL